MMHETPEEEAERIKQIILKEKKDNM